MKKLGIFFVIILVLMAQFSSVEAARKKLKKPEPLAPTSQSKAAAAAAEKEVFAQAILEQPGFVATLGELDAEVQVALALYQTSHRANAQLHMSHGDAIIYRRLLHRVLARRATGFSSELSRFTKAMAAGESFKSVQKKYTALRTAIAASRGQGELATALPLVTAVKLLMQKSADYFNSGVSEGRVIEPSQYQDAWGYMKAAKNIVIDISAGERKKHTEALKVVDAALLNLNDLWPSLTGADTEKDGPQILSDTVSKLDVVLLTLSEPN